MNLADAVAEVSGSPHMYRFSPDALGVVLAAALSVLEGERVWLCFRWGEFGFSEHPHCPEDAAGDADLHEECGWWRVVAE